MFNKLTDIQVTVKPLTTIFPNIFNCFATKFLVGLCANFQQYVFTNSVYIFIYTPARFSNFLEANDYGKLSIKPNENAYLQHN